MKNINDESGFRPTEYCVLIKPKLVEEKTSGGLILPEDVIQKDGWATNSGYLVAKGPMAFAFEDWPKEKDGEKPQIGEFVIFGRYAAETKITGKDGIEYWLIKDRDILAIKEE